MHPRLQTAKLLLPFAIALVGALPIASLVPSDTVQARQVVAQSLQSEIKQAVINSLQRPGLPSPTIRKVVIQGQYALVDWLMGEAGGLVVAVDQGGTWQLSRLGGGMPTAEYISQRAQIPLSVSQALLDKYNGASQAQAVAQSTELPMTISRAEEFLFLTVPDRDTTRSAYGGKLRLYDVHVAKMFEVTHFFCQQYQQPGSYEQYWGYAAGGGDISMGRFKISCRLAADIAAGYGLGKVERTNIQISYEEGGRATDTYQIPILNITGGKVSRWMSFTQKFRPSR